MKHILKYKLFESQEYSPDALGEKLLNLLLLKQINNKVIISLIEQGANVNKQNNRGETPVYLAAYHGKTAIIESLIKHHANLNIQDRSGWTALMVAAYNGHKDAAILLINAGADLTIVDDHDNNFIDNTSILYEDFLKWLASPEAQRMIISKAPTLYKSFRGNLIHIHPIIKKEFSHLNFADETGLLENNDHPSYLINMQLLDAAAGNNIERVKELIDAGADINCKNAKDISILHAAAALNYIDMVKYLIENGANLNTQDYFGRSALYSAAEYGRHDIAYLLIKSGADVSLLDNDNKNFIDSGSLRFANKVLNKKDIQEIILNKDPMLCPSLINKGVQIHPDIKKKFSDIVFGSETGLI